MCALDPGEGVRKLPAALVGGVENTKVMPHEQRVGKVQIGLAGDTWEVRMSPRVLRQNSIHQGGLELRGQDANKGLIAQKVIVAAARRTDATAVQRVAHQNIQVTGVLDVVAQRQAVIGSELMVEFDKSLVGILGLQGIDGLARNSQNGFGRVDEREVVGQLRGLNRGFPAPLSLVVQKEERLILPQGATERTAELILPECFGHRWR